MFSFIVGFAVGLVVAVLSPKVYAKVKAFVDKEKSKVEVTVPTDSEKK